MSSPSRPATYAVIVLTTMNLLNFIDRYVPSAVKELFKRDLQLSDQQTSLPFSAFVVVYMIASPIFGTLAEKGRRPQLIAFGVAVWSLATAGAAAAQGFASLLIARALVGVGEAAYATIAPTLIADFFPPDKRNRIMTVFYVATPIGVALGFVLGGLLGQHLGWRASFLAVGLPGLLAALLALRIDEPPRGQFDVEKREPPPWSQALRELVRNRRYVATVLGYIGVTFAVGGIGEWFPTFLARERGFTLAEAGSVAGASIIIGGLLGTVAGGVVSEALAARGVKEPYLIVCGGSLVPGVVAAGYAIFFARGKLEIAIALSAAQVLLWMYNGPVNTMLVNSVDGSMRARAFGLALLSIHILGDVISPPIIGAVSDATGRLDLGIGVVLCALVFAAVMFLGGAALLSSRTRATA